MIDFISFFVKKDNKKTLKLVVLVCFFLSFKTGFTSELDSVALKADTSRIKDLLFSSSRLALSDPNLALKPANKAYNLSLRSHVDNYIIESSINLATIYDQIGLHSKALELLRKKSHYLQKQISPKLLYENFTLIGNIYRPLGKHELAIDYYLKALNIAEKMKDNTLIASTKGNLGIIFYIEGEKKIALDYFSKALEVFKETGDLDNVAACFNNLGNVYLADGNVEAAIDYYNQSLQIRQKSGTEKEIAASYGNIAIAYNKNGLFKESLKYHNKSLEIYRSLNDYKQESRTLNNIGVIYFDNGNFELAERFFLQCNNIAKKYMLRSILKANFYNLQELYERKSNYNKALSYFKKYAELKDTLQSIKVIDRIKNLELTNKINEQESEIIILENQKKLQEENVLKQKIVISFSIFIIILLGLLFFFNKRTSTVKKQRLKLEKVLLQDNLILKEKELSSVISYLTDKNKVLDSIQTRLQIIASSLEDEQAYSKINYIIKDVDKHINNYQDWARYKESFEFSFPNYISKLQNKYSNLTHNDIKACVYVRSGLSTKEIASFLNISVEGAKSAMKRLKKKMNIGSEISLSEFLKRF